MLNTPFLTIRTYLKKNKLIYLIYGYFQTRKMLNIYSKIVQFYSVKTQALSNNAMLNNKGLNRLWVNRFNNRKPVIYWVGNDEHQDNSGFLQSLSKISKVYVFSNKEEYGQFWNHKPSEFEKRNEQSLKLYNDINILEEKVDILLMQTWGFRIDVGVIDKIKREFGCKFINIGMDEKHTYWVNGIPEYGTYGLKGVVDLALTSIPEAVNWYKKEGIPSFFFPEASDKNFFFPVNIQKRYDIGMVGGNYGIRSEIVKALVRSGFKVKVYGDGWPNGRIGLKSINDFYNQCKIVLGVGTVGYSNSFCSLKLRDFDVPMSGAFYLTSYCDDLLTLYIDDEEVVMYHSIKDLIKKCEYYLKNEDTRNCIAKKSYIRAVENHTYDKRISDLIKKIRYVH